MRSLPHRDIGQSLYEALRTGKSITTLTERYPEMSIDDAYKISLAFLKTRQSKNKEVVIPFEAGEIILSGSLVPLEPVVKGDEMLMTIEGLGECAVAFV